MARAEAGMRSPPSWGGKAPSDSSVAVFIPKGRPEYRDWINQMAEAVQMPASVLVDQASVEKARRHRFRPPPPP